MIVETRMFALALMILVTSWSVGLRRLWKNTEALGLLKLIEPPLSRVDYNFMSRIFVSITLTRTRKESKLKCTRFVLDYINRTFWLNQGSNLQLACLFYRLPGLQTWVDSRQTEAGNGNGNGNGKMHGKLSVLLDSTFLVNSLDSLGGLN